MSLFLKIFLPGGPLPGSPPPPSNPTLGERSQASCQYRSEGAAEWGLPSPPPQLCSSGSSGPGDTRMLDSVALWLRPGDLWGLHRHRSL